MISRWLISGLFVLTTTFALQAQTISVVKDRSHREVVPGTDGCDNPPLCHYYPGFVSWNDDLIKEYTYRTINGGNVVEFMNWRIVYPLNYDSTRTQKYPMIVMMHGAGESGRIWTGQYNYATNDVRFDNNGSNLIHGGQAHLNAVLRNPSLSNAFPGIVIWPQASYNGAWENGWNGGNMNETGALVTKIIDWLLINKNIDPDRVYTHGLSNGAKGTWEVATKRADLFAAILPMSGVGSDMTQMAPILNTTPLWLFQGGTDTNPRPQAAVDAIAALEAAGGDPRYTLYPTLGHGTWNTAYAEPDFFSWMLSKSKKNIHVFGGDPNICPGGTLRLGFSDKFLSYQWTRDGVDIPGATTRFYDATLTGTYTVKYRRRITPKWETTDWAESNPRVIGTKAASTYVPLLTNSGSTIQTVDLPGVDNKINLTAPIGYPTYYWFKNGVQVASGTSNTRLINAGGSGAAVDAGTYTVKVLEQTGCISAASNSIIVTWNSTQPTSPRPVQPTMTGTSPTEINVSWTDYSGEMGYELWRIRFGLGGYSFQPWTLIKVLPANTVSFLDIGLRPDATYRYVIRAILPSGQGVFSLEPYVNGNTQPDLIPPTAPTNLIASNIKDTQVTLTWDPSTDNDLVYKYEIYNGSNLLTTLTGNADGNPLPANTTTLTGLVTGMTYFLSVRAIDFKNNYSPFAESVTVTTLAPTNGLSYKYYQFTGTMPGPAGQQLNETTPQTPAAFNFNQTPTAAGTVSTFSLTPRQQNDNIVFAYDGFVEIDQSGYTTFWTRSDDGSRLYINGTLVVNNDGAHGEQNRLGRYNFPSAGKYPIRVTFFEQGGGEFLAVRYRAGDYTGVTNPTSDANYNAATIIPSTKLFLTGATIVNYYSKSTGDLASTASWGTATDGSGTAPANFTGALNYFNIRNRATADINTTWSVSGSGSKVIVGNGTNPLTVNINAGVAATIDANNNTTINLNHATIPAFGVLHPSSNVNFNYAGTTAIPNAMYGNVTLASSNLYNLSLNSTTVQGNLTIGNGAVTSGVANNLSTLRIGGNLVVNNISGNPFPANGPDQYALVFTGGTNHVISFTNPVNPNLFSIQADFGDQVLFNNLTGNTITVGSNQGGGILLKSGSKLDLGNNNLVITGRGTINSNNETGALNMTGGNFTFSSTATQNNNIYFSLDNSLNNLTSSVPINNRSSILTAVKVNNLVTVGSGELNTGDGYLTLRSISDGPGGTARIGPLLNGAKVSGKITVERYMSGEGRIYRYISSPVRNVTAADLQAFFPITGNFSGASVISGVTSNASMFQYTEPNYIQFPAVGGTNLDTLRRGKGYTPFIREASAPTTWKVTGEPYQGTIPFTLTGGTGSTANGWNLLGNPYPSPIKWTGNSTGGWTMSGVNNTVYVRENSNIAPGGFIWRHFNGSTGTFDGVIAPGQAFWVRTTTASPSLIISESAKQIIDGTFFREGWPDNTLEIVLKNSTFQDATHIQWLDGASPAFDTNIDGVKQNNGFFNLSSLTSDGKPMAINLTTTNYCEQEISFRIENAAAGLYELNINGSSSIISGDEVTFTDNFTQTQKVISDTEVYAFSITDDPASKADGRFTLRLKKPEVVLNQTLKTDAACEQSSPIIKVNNSQPGVTYQAFVDGVAISEDLTSIGGTLELAVNPALIEYGSTPAIIKAGFKSCNSFELPMTIAVQRDTLPVPEILMEPLKLIASTENANYTWYFNGEELEGQTGQELLAPEDGLYVVEVTRASCIKKSDTVDYAAGRITGIEKPNRLQQLYPNPTRDKVVITMEQPIDFPSIRVITSIGQSMQIQTTRISNESAEVDFSQLPTGLYLLQVNGQRYRVLKE